MQPTIAPAPHPRCPPPHWAAGDTKPGDDAPPGTPGTGDDICPDCNGSGRIGRRRCETCDGTGVVNKGVGGA